MIKICFPPGCYGHYLGRCVYNFTNLRTGEFNDFEFNTLGSSHELRVDTELREQLRVGHFAYATDGIQHEATLHVMPEDLAVTILPSPGHWLDYYNNQFVKQNKSDLVQACHEQLSVSELQHKLQTQWQYSGTFDHTVPTWILRELFSFLIWDILKDAYTQDRCCIEHAAEITAGDLFQDFVPVFQTLCHSLNLAVTVTDECILRNSQLFIQAQKYHGSQSRCQAWTQSVIDSVADVPCPAQTLFDQAYIQHCLRQAGYEIQCDGLDTMPALSHDMTALIYKI